MTHWHDPDVWRALVDGTGCPVCVRGQPLNIVATLPASWVTMSEDAPMVGYLCLVSRIHVVELHDFTDQQAAAFMVDARRVSRALLSVTHAIKLNYEMHGNILPHLHMHFFPRHPGDRFEGRAIDPRIVKDSVYAEGEFARIRSAVVMALGSIAPVPDSA